MSTTLYRTPSGRLHHLVPCSGGARKSNVTKVVLTDEELLTVPIGLRCRCAWRSFELARERAGA